MYRNQRGGIVSFIVIAVALAGLLGGALYFSKQQGREARNDAPAPKISQREDKAPETAKPENKADDAPATSQPVPGNDSPEPRAQEQAPAPTTSTSRVANTGPTQELPATGAAEDGIAAVAFGVIAFAGYKLFGARRQRQRAALRS